MGARRAAGQAMTGDEGRPVVEAMLPQAEERVIERQRKLPLGMWGRALVIAAGTPGGADQADVLRSSLACEVPPVGPAAKGKTVVRLSYDKDPCPWICEPTGPPDCQTVQKSAITARLQA